MKKIITIIGWAFILLIIVIGGFIGYTAYKGTGLDKSSKAYIEANVPPIISTWSKEEMLKRSSPELLKVINENPGQLDQLFVKLSKLGQMRSFGDVTGDSNISYTTQDGKVTTAAYTANAKFENGDAHMSIRLILSSGGHWQLLLFNVNSPIFLQ